jgi:hypothetical protein
LLSTNFIYFYSEYEVCNPHYFSKAICGQYPSWQQCGCPLRAGEVHLKNVKYDLPDLGLLGDVMAVSNLHLAPNFTLF